MKKRIILLVLVFTFGIFVDKLLFTNKSEEFNNIKVKKSVSNISMMLETGASTGVYELTTRSNWPTDGYILNKELSKCENGSSLSWDDDAKTVVMSGNVSDKCYVYFDVYLLTVINSLTEETTSSSIKLTVNATAGTKPITKYYYSKDNGTSYTESTSNNYTFTGLSSNTTYNIKVYAVDEKGKSSEVYSKIVKTPKNEITFYINDNPYTALEDMTWQDWVTSDYHDTICDEYLDCLRKDGNRVPLMYELSCVGLSDKIVENGYYDYAYIGAPEPC